MMKCAPLHRRVTTVVYLGILILPLGLYRWRMKKFGILYMDGAWTENLVTKAAVVQWWSFGLVMLLMIIYELEDKPKSNLKASVLKSVERYLLGYLVLSGQICRSTLMFLPLIVWPNPYDLSTLPKFSSTALDPQFRFCIILIIIYSFSPPHIYYRIYIYTRS